jgi:glucose/arabinose dehydrogenase
VRAVAAAVVAAAALAVWPAAASAQVRLQGIGTFVRPVHVTGAPGDYERLYVVEQRGTIQVVRGGQASQFLDLRSAVRSPEDGAGNEEGLLSVALPPDFQQSRLLYVYFTDGGGNNRVEELRATSADSADPASRREVLVLQHPVQANHNGGQLQFGPDGFLYLAPGDGGGGNDPEDNAEDLSSPLGKVLRIDPRQTVTAPYAVPPDNPFVGTPGARGEIWSYGLRNPFRFSFDRSTGDLTIGASGRGTRRRSTSRPRHRAEGGAWTSAGTTARGASLREAPSRHAHVQEQRAR